MFEGREGVLGGEEVEGVLVGAGAGEVEGVEAVQAGVGQGAGGGEVEAQASETEVPEAGGEGCALEVGEGGGVLGPAEVAEVQGAKVQEASGVGERAHRQRVEVAAGEVEGGEASEAFAGGQASDALVADAVVAEAQVAEAIEEAGAQEIPDALGAEAVAGQVEGLEVVEVFAGGEQECAVVSDGEAAKVEHGDGFEGGAAAGEGLELGGLELSSALEVQDADEAHGGVGALAASPGSGDEGLGHAEEDVRPGGGDPSERVRPACEEAVGVIEADGEVFGPLPGVEEGGELIPGRRGGLLDGQGAERLCAVLEVHRGHRWWMRRGAPMAHG